MNLQMKQVPKSKASQAGYGNMEKHVRNRKIRFKLADQTHNTLGFGMEK